MQNVSQDSARGSWLGERVVKTIEGDFIFDNYWGNNVTIKTNVPVGSSWVLYSDSGSVYYQAQMLTTDTMSVLGVVDSVKRILITAHDSMGIVVTDPLDSFQIILSKNYGFVQVLDLYTFPYHKVDSVYQSGLDFFLDFSTWPYNYASSGGNPPSRDISIYKIINFINPNDAQLYNWNVGDIYEYSYEEGTFYGLYPPTMVYYTLDTIVNKVITGHTTTYAINESSFQYSPPSQVHYANSYSVNDTNYSLLSRDYMPEERTYYSLSMPIYYFPDDTQWCVQSPAYYFSSTWGGIRTYYKLGLSLVTVFSASPNPDYYYDRLIYYNRGSNCGGIVWPVGINAPDKLQLLQIFPNPATNKLTISGSQPIGGVEIFNMVGQKMLSAQILLQNTELDISQFPPGVYLVRINNSIVQRFVKQ